MAFPKLPNYVKTYRKRSALSQDEVAYLLGCKSGSKISRYERFSRKPTLETALRYEALFGVPVRDLFAGVFQKAEREVLKRAHLLARKLCPAKSEVMTARKLAALRAISEPGDRPVKSS